MAMMVQVHANTVRLMLLAVLAASGLALASCSSTSSNADALAIDETSAPATSPDGYPTFSAPLKAAMSQMTDVEAEQMGRELDALNRGRKAGNISEADYWKRVKELKLLADKHSADTIAEIEATPKAQ